MIEQITLPFFEEKRFVYIYICFLFHLNSLFFIFQSDMLMSIATSKPTVNEADLKKLEEFTSDFGQEG